MRVAFVSLATPMLRNSWSGMPWYSYREIRRRFDDVHLVDHPRLDLLVERLSALQRYGLSVRQRSAVLRLYGRLVERKLTAINPDVVISIGASHKLTEVRPDWPIVHVSDGLFGTIVGYYEKFGRFHQDVLRDAHVDHQRFIDKTRAVLFASSWARDSALSLYRLSAETAHVVPFGANLDVDPGRRARTGEGPLTLLFVGYDWRRKGGELVLAAWAELRRRTGDARLHIVGCTPPGLDGVEGVTVHGRLSKSDPVQRQRLNELFDSASFFFMPTRQEAFGMVFCEAAAFGLPSVASHTGGVPTVIEPGVTGLLLPVTADGPAYVEPILSVWQDKARYAAMSEAARDRYERLLNWQAWGASVADVVTAVGRR